MVDRAMKYLLVLVASALFVSSIFPQFPMLSTLHEPATDRPADVTIEVWSDVVCPLCYVGKRRLERALASLPDGVTERSILPAASSFVVYRETRLN